MTSADASAPSIVAAARRVAAIPRSLARWRAVRVVASRRARPGTPRPGARPGSGSPRPRPRRRARRRCGGRPGTGRRAGRARRRPPSRSCSPRRRPRASAARSMVSVSTSPAITPSDASSVATASNSGGLSSWRSRWYASGRPLSSASTAVSAPMTGRGPAADELGRVRVLLVGHHRGAGRERVGDAHEPEARVRPPGDLLGQAAEVDHRRARRPPRTSTTKSRSATASSEFAVTPSKPSSAAVASRSSG